jgi:gliding motility-associated-like protein
MEASHYAGAEIFYEHVAGTVRDYKVTLIVYGDVSGIPIDWQADINYSSSCNAGGTVANIANLEGATAGFNEQLYIVDQATYSCTQYDPSDPNSVEYYKFTFETTISLPTNCGDWVFSWQSQCCRNNAIDNINPGNAIYVEARLNNNLGQNSSPRFTSPAVKQFCVKGPNDPPFPFVQSSIETDGDSIFYTLKQPQGAGGVLLAWQPGYSTASPISSWTLPVIDQSTGTFFFLPSNPELVVLRIEVEETRFDPSSLTWVFVGNTSRDVQLPVLTTCTANISDGPKIDISQPGFTNGSISADSLRDIYGVTDIWAKDSSIDPISGGLMFDSIPIIDYTCFDDDITLTFNETPKIYLPRSFGALRDEFRLIGPDGVARPVVDVSYLPDPGSPTLTSELYLQLHKRLDVNGLYLLQIKRGVDGNTLQDDCGYALPAGQIMIIRVQNCPDLNYSLDRVTVVDDKSRLIEWSIDDPSYLQADLFNYWRLGMNVGGATYFREIDDINQRSFLDTLEFLKNHVDFQNFTYNIQLVQDADFKAPALEQITTVRLRAEMKQIDTQNKQLDLGWNAYNGFRNDSANTRYQAFLGNANPGDSTIIVWNQYGGNNANNFFTQYDIDESTTANDGLYAFKIEATDATNPPPAGKISESNWIFFKIGFVPLPDLTLRTYTAPNVFTPNGDDRNDRFYIESADGGREFADIQLSVFNRWGQIVYEDDKFGFRNNANQGWDGSNIYTGQQVSDGVYYYTVKMFDPETGTSEDMQGSVTIMGSSGSN